jgi:hypothetical protein
MALTTSYKILGQSSSGAVLENTVSNKVLTSNIATLTTGADHGLAIGDKFYASNVDTTFNGTYTVLSVPTSTTLTYSKTASNVTTAAVTTGSFRGYKGQSAVAISNKVKTNGIVTLTTSSAHNLLVGDYVFVYVNDANIDGYFIVLSVPTSTTFTYVFVGSNVSTAAVTTGSVNGYSMQSLYTVPSETNVVVSNITICNRINESTFFDIAISPNGANLSDNHYISDYNLIGANETITLNVGLAIDSTDVIRVRGYNSGLTFSAFGTTIA